MIKLKLDQLARKLGKNISQIARETGINRNTITALFHNKVDGIKFPTLERICEVYGTSPQELFEFRPEKSKKKENKDFEPYKQEGEIVPFTAWPWMAVSSRLDEDYFEEGFGRIYGYYKNGYGFIYWDKKVFDRVSRQIFERYGDKEKLEGLYRDYRKRSERLESIYRNIDPPVILGYDKRQLEDFFADVWTAYRDFWAASLFIEAFDAGFDMEMVRSVADRYGLDAGEVAVLTNPVQMTFNNERKLAILRIVEEVIGRKKTRKKFDLTGYLSDSEAVKAYMAEFDYYKSNYAKIEHIDLEEVRKEVEKYLRDKKLFQKDRRDLENYSSEQSEKIRKILNKHRLKDNPLHFFNQLTFWREDRKKVNLMGIHVLDIVLGAIESKTGIAKKFLSTLSYDEVGNVLKGLVDRNILRRRTQKGVMAIVDTDGYQMIEGEQADSLKEELEQKLRSVGGPKDILTGQVASQGYAKGRAKIILDSRKFSKFQEGEILVASMTRPDFLPIMKQAIAIVTDEGGITCHASIVSRELGIPCIIGTKVATQTIKDGDLIEVRANHGTVRILERKKRKA